MLISKTFSGGNLLQSTEFQKNPKQMRVYLPSVVKTADLTGVSNTAAAKIVSAVLVDLNVVSNPDKVVDKNKIRREIKKNGNRLQSQNTYLSHHLGGLYFHGRKDRIILQVDNRRKDITEELIALMEEPNGSYFGRLSLSSPVKAIHIANGILSYITKKDISLAVGHLFTSRKRLFGSLLSHCEKAAALQFTANNYDLLEGDAKDLSTDQQYLYIVWQAIKNGNCPQNLLERNPDKLAHSRWAYRVLGLYASTENPSENLKLITDFIMKLDAPMWFKIKTKPLLQHGARHIWEMTKISRQFPEAVRSIIDKIIEGNSYFAQPESVLLEKLADPGEHIRRLAFHRIKKARTNTSKELRVFKAPKLNFDADDYIDITDCPFLLQWIMYTYYIFYRLLTMQFQKSVYFLCFSARHIAQGADSTIVGVLLPCLRICSKALLKACGFCPEQMGCT
nr:unnamed protein product [Callosobruchus analis]